MGAGRGAGPVPYAGKPALGSTAGEREALLRVDAQMWRIRWFAVVFTLAQFVLYQPPAGIAVPFPRLLVGLLVASTVVSTNLISLVARRVRDTAMLARIGFAQLALDCATVLAVVWLFSFDSNSALWALLILNVIEGALRARLRGAILTWTGVTIGYVAREIWAAHVYAHAALRIDSLTYRMGIVLIVAAATGYLAENLQARISDQRTSRRASERRAELLRKVAEAGRTLSFPDAESLFASVADASLTLGFDASVIALLNGATFTLTAPRGLPEDFVSRTHRADAGLIGVVRERGQTVVIEDYTEWPDSLEELRPLGFRAVAGVPIWTGSDLEGVLVVGSLEQTNVSSDEVECLDLLATQAGAALATVHRFNERRILEGQLQHEALHDSLTGLPNRALFTDRLDHCLERKSRAPSPTAVLFLDLDGFKRINDSLGHDAGDALLRSVARRLQSGLRVGDTVARWGGDEFIVLLEEPRSEDIAVDGARRIIDELREPFVIDGRQVYMSASIGIAYGLREASEGSELMREADVAMYRAKERGGGDCEAYRPTMIARTERRLDMELELRRSTDEGLFVPYYQPAVSTTTGNVIGFEALLRWNHPTQGIIPASEFIGLAEERDLIIRLGRLMIEMVCRQLEEWHETEPDWPGIPISINFSPKELRQTEFVDRLVQSMTTHGIEPRELIIEVTERALIEGDWTLKQLQQLGELGLRIAVDDFGLGYSSLTYLKRYPFSILKIDKSFVAGITHVAADQAIVRSILSLAKDLDIIVVAEGVETKEQLDYLRDEGCEYVQGYHLHRPLPPSEIVALVRSTEALNA